MTSSVKMSEKSKRMCIEGKNASDCLGLRGGKATKRHYKEAQVNFRKS